MKDRPEAEKIFFSKNDPQDLRWGDFFESRSDLDSLKKGDFILFGYPDDEGVQINGGRSGSAFAPKEIRKALYKMTPSKKVQGRFFDGGDLPFGDGSQGLSLVGRREFAKARVEKSLQAGCRILTLGGGHDYAYPDLAAFCRQVKKSKKKPFIINFDAHLDVRPDEIKGPHSGTSFYTILKEFPGIEFYEIGIQKWCNSPHHRQWALDQGAKIIDFHDVDQAPKLMKVVKNKVLKKFDKSKHELALSIDIDAFCSAQAPGASQVFPLGLDGHGFLPLLEDIIKKAKPKLMGIYEVNPSFDVDARTSKLAAILSYTFLTNHQ